MLPYVIANGRPFSWTLSDAIARFVTAPQIDGNGVCPAHSLPVETSCRKCGYQAVPEKRVASRDVLIDVQAAGGRVRQAVTWQARAAVGRASGYRVGIVQTGVMVARLNEL